MLEIVSQVLLEVIRNVMLLPEVGGKLRAGDRKGQSHSQVDSRSEDAYQGPQIADIGRESLWIALMS